MLPERFDQAFWDERYRSHTAVGSGNPNVHLVAEVDGVSPGSALDVGCGEGADAIWLAARGWRVTAINLSMVALQRAAANANQAGADAAAQLDSDDWEIMANAVAARPETDPEGRSVTIHDTLVRAHRRGA